MNVDHLHRPLENIPSQVKERSAQEEEDEEEINNKDQQKKNRLMKQVSNITNGYSEYGGSPDGELQRKPSEFHKRQKIKD